MDVYNNDAIAVGLNEKSSNSSLETIVKQFNLEDYDMTSQIFDIESGTTNKDWAYQTLAEEFVETDAMDTYFEKNKHNTKVALYSVAIAQSMDLDKSAQKDLFNISLVKDLGLNLGKYTEADLMHAKETFYFQNKLEEPLVSHIKYSTQIIQNCSKFSDMKKANMRLTMSLQYAKQEFKEIPSSNRKIRNISDTANQYATIIRMAEELVIRSNHYGLNGAIQQMKPPEKNDSYLKKQAYDSIEKFAA